MHVSDNIIFTQIIINPQSNLNFLLNTPYPQPYCPRKCRERKDIPTCTRHVIVAIVRLAVADRLPAGNPNQRTWARAERQTPSSPIILFPGPPLGPPALAAPNSQ